MQELSKYMDNVNDFQNELTDISKYGINLFY